MARAIDGDDMKEICDRGRSVQIQIFVRVSGKHYPLYIDTAKQRILYQPGLYIPGDGDAGANSNQSTIFTLEPVSEQSGGICLKNFILTTKAYMTATITRPKRNDVTSMIIPSGQTPTVFHAEYDPVKKSFALYSTSEGKKYYLHPKVPSAKDQHKPGKRKILASTLPLPRDESDTPEDPHVFQIDQLPKPHQ